MSAKKILLFVLACFLLLGVLAVVFPKDGISLGKRKLRFPELREVLLSKREKNIQTTPVLSPEQQLEKMAADLEMQQLSALADSLDFYQKLFSTASIGIQFPDNDPSLFDAFFLAMRKAEEKGEIVRVLHYGDSQIEQDRITSTLRKNWQSRFGGMGFGMLPALQTIPTPYVNQEQGGDMQKFMVYSHEEFRSEHNQYGPMAQFVRVRDSARVLIAPKAAAKHLAMGHCMQLRVMVANVEPGFRAILNLDGQWDERLLNDSCEQVQVLSWVFDKPVQNIDLSFWGNADIQAILLDGTSGVAVDNIPMRGCSGTIFTSIQKESLREAYRHLNPHLFILEFGGNRMPVIKSEEHITLYMKRLAAQIRYLKSLAPQAAILFIGPADMACTVDGELQTYPLLEELIEALRRMCMDNGVAFWDMYRVMGGPGTIIEWTKTQPALAASDYIHFTVRGAERIAGLLNRSFNLCYDYHLFREKHLDDSTMLRISCLDSIREKGGPAL